MKSNGLTELASLDRHFDKVKGIQRVKLQSIQPDFDILKTLS